MRPVRFAEVEAGSYALGESDGLEAYDAGGWACESAEGAAVPVADAEVAAGTVLVVRRRRRY
ncbi:hypothetical protein ACN2WE_22045 [Streptomyces sp. cg28]|uniref:hypothetical protein n=1 Tax=Streptomyces sp. cg28 TaxID=3403457 RepID=UPI003B21F682